MLNWKLSPENVPNADVLQTERNDTTFQNHKIKIEQSWETEPNINKQPSPQDSIDNITPSDVTSNNRSLNYAAAIHHTGVMQSGMETMCSRIKETSEIDSTISTQITGFTAGGYNITAHTCKICNRLFEQTYKKDSQRSK